MEGTEILPVTAARTCEYPDGCDEVAAPQSTCCWRHRRHGKLFGLPPAAPSIRARQVETEKTMPKCKCGCGRAPSAGREYAWGHKPKDASATNGNGTRAITVSAEARDGLAPQRMALKTAMLYKSGTASADGEEVAVFNVKMTEPMLDTFWGLLDGKSKAALLSKMGAE